MALNFTLDEAEELRPRITVFGVGGAGGNAVNNMITSGLTGVSFVVANTDAQAITQSHAPERIQIGRAITQGLGAGAKPEIGRAAAEETLPEIVKQLEGSNMCFIAAGMGGGTGTGAAPVIARAAKEMDILTVGVVTKPFQFEGAHRMKLALQGIEDLQQYVDTLIVIPNQNLFRIANERTTFAQAFQLADEVLHSGVRGVTDLILMPGLINLDYADVRTVMSEMGKAMMGTGEGEGDQRATIAAEAAISNPLLDDISLKGARAVLINVTGGTDLTLFDVDEAATRIRNDVDPEANIILGAVYNENMTGKIRVSVVATGIDGARPSKVSQSAYEENLNASSASYELSSKIYSSEKIEAPVAASAVQPMFPTAGKTWSTPKAHETSPVAPTVAARAPVAPSAKNEAPVRAHADDTLDQLVTHFGMSPAKETKPLQTDATLSAAKRAPSEGELLENPGDKNVDNASRGGFFGLIRGSAPVKTEMRKKPLETAGEEVKPSKNDENFEIPAFLRRSIY